MDVAPLANILGEDRPATAQLGVFSLIEQAPEREDARELDFPHGTTAVGAEDLHASVAEFDGPLPVAAHICRHALHAHEAAPRVGVIEPLREVLASPPEPPRSGAGCVHPRRIRGPSRRSVIAQGSGIGLPAREPPAGGLVTGSMRAARASIRPNAFAAVQQTSILFSRSSGSISPASRRRKRSTLAVATGIRARTSRHYGSCWGARGSPSRPCRGPRLPARRSPRRSGRS